MQKKKNNQNLLDAAKLKDVQPKIAKEKQLREIVLT